MNKKALIAAIGTILIVFFITKFSPREKAVKAPPPSPAVSAATAPRTLPKVEIYTTSWCPACREAVTFLQERQIPFSEYDVEKDAHASQRLREMNPAGSIPLTVIGGEKIIGFNPQVFERALGL